MISVIICSRSAQLLEKVSLNIQHTIGVEHEILAISNTSNSYSLSAAYNKTAQNAKYSMLCFMHEDVEILTRNWGKKVPELLIEYGLIGVAGSKYKSKLVTGWTTGNPQLDYYNIYHKTATNETSHYYSNAVNTTLQQCVVLDGVWLCCTKKLWQKVRFNEALLKGFHFYDIDFSFRCSMLEKVAITFDIDLIHYSQGSFNDEWIRQAFIFHNHYKKQLPASVEILNSNQVDKNIFSFWQRRLQKENISWFNRFKIKLHALKVLPGKGLMNW